MAFSLYKLLAAVIITATCLSLLFPFFGSALPAQTANTINVSAYDAQQTFNKSIYGNLNNQLIGKCSSTANSISSNCTGSFFASVTLFTGLAFVIDGFGNIVLSVLNLPSVFITLLNLGVDFVPLPTGAENILVKAVTEFIVVFLLILFMSSWMKFDLNKG